MNTKFINYKKLQINLSKAMLKQAKKYGTETDVLSLKNLIKELKYQLSEYYKYGIEIMI